MASSHANQDVVTGWLEHAEYVHMVLWMTFLPCWLMTATFSKRLLLQVGIRSSSYIMTELIVGGTCTRSSLYVLQQVIRRSLFLTFICGTELID